MSVSSKIELLVVGTVIVAWERHILRQERALCKPPDREFDGYNRADSRTTPPMRLLLFRAFRWLALLLFAASSAGCATGPGRDPRDPLEPMNRTVYQFNDHFDRVLLKPAAIVYNTAVPPPVRGGVSNFFGNFRDVTTAVNNLLQAKFKWAASDVGRVLVNSTVGIFGMFDVASRIGLQKHSEDFGQTLAVWGTPDGPYLVLPLLGPSTARDSVGLIGDYYTDPEFFLFNDPPGTYIVFTTRIVSVRADLLETEQIFNAAAIDRYAFLRDAYLQRRHNLINDGQPPPAGEPDKRRRKTLKELEEELDAEPPGKDQ
jgi:phospholipid-binding lipoprotein MlaA